MKNKMKVKKKVLNTDALKVDTRYKTNGKRGWSVITNQTDHFVSFTMCKFLKTFSIPKAQGQKTFLDLFQIVKTIKSKIRLQSFVQRKEKKWCASNTIV